MSNTAHLPIAIKDLSVFQAVLAMGLGLFIVGIVGFSHVDVIHNAAHDVAIRTRSATDAICRCSVRLFFSVVAGVAVGAAVTVALYSTVPLILELSTNAAPLQPRPSRAFRAAPDQQHAEHEHGAAAWEPKDGLSATS